ncbi:MAG: nucleotidyl transferase AbiEii/AbiGii toxin family protein [Acidobacteriia bacterium]|nr:nucleotidyl transferase AbiEii/AbiGii toxin family protein [Terriglobia bacterium]
MKARGFDDAGAKTVVLIREAAILLSSTFPGSFSLYGGANLILFHDSARTSRDLDLIPKALDCPSVDEVIKVLSVELQELAGLLGYAPLTVEIVHSRTMPCKLELFSGEGATLFTIDMGGLGAVAASGIEEHSLEAVSRSATAAVQVVSKNHLLLQKAEAFVGRARVKARDAYDINLLLGAGAVLAAELEDGLADSLAMRELDGEDLAALIATIDAKKCAAELQSVLPVEIYRPLEAVGFEPLRASLRTLFRKWL